MMKTLKTGILASGFWRLKSPRWHSGALWASDLGGGKVFRIDPDGKATSLPMYRIDLSVWAFA